MFKTRSKRGILEAKKVGDVQRLAFPEKKLATIAKRLNASAGAKHSEFKCSITDLRDIQEQRDAYAKNRGWLCTCAVLEYAREQNEDWAFEIQTGPIGVEFNECDDVTCCQPSWEDIEELHAGGPDPMKWNIESPQTRSKTPKARSTGTK
jgi:hypothetical protein